MNDNDLERRLRAETGPREQGYVPSQLPATVETGPPDGRPSHALRLAILVPAVVAGVAVVAIAAALLNGSGPDGVGAVGTPTPIVSPSPIAPTDCLPSDLLVTAEPWGGAAGSRGTVINVALKDGRYPCEAAVEATVRVTDADGAAVVAGRPGDGRALSGRTQLVESGETLGITVLWSNWCLDEPAMPLGLSIRLALWPDFVPVSIASGGTDPVPPCNGGTDTVLYVSELQGTQ